MNSHHSGLLAIWSTITSEDETDYLHWLTREHVFERVGVIGFQSGRVFRRQDSAPSEYLMLYELENAAVMGSPEYLSRLNNPTPWTQRIMPRLQHFRRGGGSVVLEQGQAGACGTHIAIMRFTKLMPEGLTGTTGRKFVGSLVELDWIVCVRVMVVQPDATSIATREKSMRRSQEGAFDGLIVLEALDEKALDTAVAKATEFVSTNNGAFERYSEIFSFREVRT